MSVETTFVYVDAHYHPVGLTDEKIIANAKKWRRMLPRELREKIREPSGNQNCFCTVQRYSDAMRQGIDEDGLPEVHYCGFFFDFDRDPSAHDGCIDDAMEEAIKDVLSVIDFFKALGVEEQYMRLWFSGSKGFHLIVHPQVFGITPSRHNTGIMKIGAAFLKERYELKTLDMSVYTGARMWRLPNSIHHSSGLFKIELYHSDLHKGYSHIAEKARGAMTEPLYGRDEFRDIKPEDDASAFWKRLRKDYEDLLDLERVRPVGKILKAKEWPACVKDVLQNGLKKPGTRNRMTMTLANFFKDTGVSQAECLSILLEWVVELPDPDGKKHERIANTRAVVRSEYNNEHTGFSCGYIRALGSSDDRISCTKKEGCDTVGDDHEAQRPAKIPRVPLSKASDAVYIGKRVSIPVMVTGKNESPYAYPKKIRLTCTPNVETTMCQGCRIMSKEGNVEADMNMRNQTLIDLINCHSSRRNGVIKGHLGVPAKCAANQIETLDWGNIEEVRLQPNVMTTGVIDSRPSDGDNKKNIGDPIDEGTYCNRIGYFVAHESIEINKKYDIEATVWGHPKDQRVCHIFDVATASQDDIDKVRTDKEMVEMLKAFQPKKGQTVAEKFNEIHDDLESNIHMIWGRREVAIALDIAYHAVIGFGFQGVYERKGYVELLIIGDSGNGKTKLVERMMNHYQLGEITGVEGGKRTGLIWANHNIGGRFILTWGKIPQNDRRLVCLDEFSGMPQEEVSTMTRLRTEGIAEAQGINTAITNARTRLVFLTNPRNGRPLSYFNYGIEAVNKLFKEHQDVRRIDLAVCVQSGDVPLEVINKRHRPDMSTHNYTTSLCKSLVLWAWSRDPRQIQFEPDAEELILKLAIETGKKYRCDIPLVEPSDQRIKLARLAAAVAARMFSTEDGENLLVKVEHVEFANTFNHACYDHLAMGYNIYAANVQERMFLSDEQRSELKKWWLQRESYQHLRRLFLAGTYFRKGDVGDQTGYNKEQLNDLFKQLSKRLLITNQPGGYRKTEMFTKFLKEFDTIDNTDPPF